MNGKMQSQSDNVASRDAHCSKKYIEDTQEIITYENHLCFSRVLLKTYLNLISETLVAEFT